MDKKSSKELFEKAITADSIKQAYLVTLDERVQRYLQVKPHGIIPNTPFAAPSSECSLLFRDGHFYACIALVQAVAEAIVRHICDMELQKHNNDFKKNVKELHNQKFISDQLQESLLKIWLKRNDYHHLNSSVEADKQILEDLAREKTHLLTEVEGQIFEFKYGIDGSLIPKNPKYWKVIGGKWEVFLRLSP